MQTADIRSAYLEFFGARGHKLVPSSSLVPGNDPTLLFTNSGMVQFKDALTGRERLDYRRAVSCQRCVRAGGKHNDLENVGHTARHHTLFEMLGNFSFGDYFKEEAIAWAWEFVREVLGWRRERIWVTVHPTDDEARKLWIDKIGMPAERVVDHEENFWAMGDTGPCGPNTELFYDQGPRVAGGPPGTPEEDGDRFLEFWNLVFPQFDRAPDGTLEPLASPGIDTGMGLERTAAIAQGVLTNFEADVFRPVMTRAAGMAGIRDDADLAANVSLRVIADHIRAASFLVADGVLPSNEDRGYVLRRIVRRALRHGHQLNLREPFFHALVGPLAEEMGAAYPLLEERRASIETVLLGEEERFARTLDRGMVLLERTIADLSGDTIPGAVAFELYDTYGFPVDLTADVARERGLGVDMTGFEAVMETQRARSREASRFDASEEQRVRVESNVRFEGYESLANPANVVALFRTGDGTPEETDRLDAPASGLVVLDRTPFYAEAGGQVGDAGEILADGARFSVLDTTPGRWPAPAPGRPRGRRVAGGPGGACGGGRGAPRRRGPQSFRDPPAAPGAARRARPACPAEGVPGGPGSPAFRLLALRARLRRRVAPDRKRGQYAHSREQPRHHRDHAVRRSDGARRGRALRREVRRRSPGADLGRRLLRGTLRRHPRAAHWRHRPDAHRLRVRHRRRRSPHRSGDWTGRVGLARRE